MIRSTMIALPALLIGALWVQAADYYVSPAGDDNNPGTRAAPLATLAKARDTIRLSRKAGKEPITVHLADGTYFLGETLVLATQDSGTAEAPITYAAEHEGKAIVSGAVELKGLQWVPARDGVVKAAVPAELLERCAFDELWAGDAKLAIDGKAVADCRDLLEVLSRQKGKTVELHVVGAADRKVKVKVE